MVAACGKQRMAAAAAVTLQLLLLAATHAAAPAAASHGRLVHIEQGPSFASDAQHPDPAQGGRSLHHSSGHQLQRQQHHREQHGQPASSSGLLPTRQLRAVRLPHAQPGTNTRDIDARITSHWQEVTAICPDLAYRSCEGVDRSLWTDVYQTQVVDFNFYGLGQWSTFKLVTFDHHRRRRDRGGDSWHVLLRDRRQELKVPARVFDEGNGNYTVATIIHKPGTYKMSIWLYYSDCNGYQEPRVPFHELEPELRKEKACWIGQTTQKKVFPHVTVHRSPKEVCNGCAARGTAAPSLLHKVWRTEWYLYREGGTIGTTRCCRPTGTPTPVSGPPKRFIYYGDSTVKNSWEVLLYPARKPCKVDWRPRILHEEFRNPEICRPVNSMEEIDPEMDKVLKRCTDGLPWTSVPVGVNQPDLLQPYPMAQYFNMSDFQYNDTFFRNHVPPLEGRPKREFTVIYSDGWGCRILPVVLPDLRVVQQGDVLVINIGAHCQRTHPFHKWRAYMDELADELRTIIAATGAQVIWRTTYIIEEHVLRSHPKFMDLGGYLASAHFNTDARRMLFDSYAEHVLLPAGVLLWDVYGVTSIGDNKPHDMFHSDGATLWAMTRDLMDVFVCKPVPLD